MALIVVAADKGAPGVTTTALALAAVWPRPVLLAECDPAGGDLAFRFPAADGGRLDPRHGMLSLAVAARRGLQPGQVWEHTQKLYGGLDVLIGVTNAEQGAGLSTLWGQLGRALAGVPQADVIADCGRLGTDGPAADLLAEAQAVLLLTRAEMGEVIRLRDRAGALAAAVEKRGRRGFVAEVAVIADQKNFNAALAEVAHVLNQARAPARVLGGIASDARAAGLLRGDWGGKLDKSLLIRSVREIAGQLAAALPPPAGPAASVFKPAPGPGPHPTGYQQPAGYAPAAGYQQPAGYGKSAGYENPTGTASVPTFQPAPGMQSAGHQQPAGYAPAAGYQQPAVHQQPAGYVTAEQPAGYVQPAGGQPSAGYEPPPAYQPADGLEPGADGAPSPSGEPRAGEPRADGAQQADRVARHGHVPQHRGR